MAETQRTKILTHLWFAKEAEEAAQLYTSIFPDSRIDHAADDVALSVLEDGRVAIGALGIEQVENGNLFHKRTDARRRFDVERFERPLDRVATEPHRISVASAAARPIPRGDVARTAPIRPADRYCLRQESRNSCPCNSGKPCDCRTLVFLSLTFARCKTSHAAAVASRTVP